MGCAWRACLSVALALIVILLGAAAGTVESSRPGLRNFKTTSDLKQRLEVVPASAAMARKLLLQSTTDSEVVAGGRQGGVKPAEVGAGSGAGLGRWRMKMAIVRLEDSSGVAREWGAWFKTASPPGPPGPLPGTGRIPLRPGEEVVKASLHPVPSGPNPLHN